MKRRVMPWEDRDLEDARKAGANLGERIGAKLARAIVKILDDAGVKRPLRRKKSSQDTGNTRRDEP